MKTTIEKEQQMLKIWQSITSKPMTDREVKFAMAVAEAEREACAKLMSDASLEAVAISHERFARYSAECASMIRMHSTAVADSRPE